MNPWLVVLVILAGLFLVMYVIAIVMRPGSRYAGEKDHQNPLEGKKVVFIPDEDEPMNADGVRGHLEAVDGATNATSFYTKYVKRVLDVVLSFSGLVLLSPVFLWLTLWIVIDDPGPVLFTQKRIGKNKRYFKLRKFRSMKMSAPHDKPTHMIDNPDQYITKAGRFIRLHSLARVIIGTTQSPVFIRVFENCYLSLKF